MASVSINSLEVTFGTLKVLENLNLEVEEGEFIVLLGPSGCGKSTLLNSIAGLLDISDGEIWIDGKNVTWEEPKDRGIGMVFQSYALYPRMTVEGNLSFGLNLFPGESFLGRKYAFASDFYLIGGVGWVDFAGEEELAWNFGFGYKLLATDWLSIRLDARDHIFENDVLGESDTNHNLEFTGGLSIFF